MKQKDLLFEEGKKYVFSAKLFHQCGLDAETDWPERADGKAVEKVGTVPLANGVVVDIGTTENGSWVTPDWCKEVPNNG